MNERMSTFSVSSAVAYIALLPFSIANTR